MAGIRSEDRFGARLLLFAASLALTIVLAAIPAHAQLSSYYPSFFTLQSPESLSAVLYGGGYVSDQAGVTQQGFQIEQSLTPYLGVFGRATGYQLYVGHGFSNPLQPSASGSSRYNFGRFQGGVDFGILPGTHLLISGGHDAGDSDAPIIEGDFNSWMFAYSLHPLNFSFNSIHDYQNGVTSNEFDFRTVMLSTENYLLLGGAGGAWYTGGITNGNAGQGGPDVTVFYRPWQLGFATQFGYGSSRQYGEVTMFRQFAWPE